MPFASFENSRVENALAKVASSIGDRYRGGAGLSICPEILLRSRCSRNFTREKERNISPPPLRSSTPSGERGGRDIAFIRR